MSAFFVYNSDTNYMNAHGIFINQYGRLRSGWRLAIFLLAAIFTISVLGGILGSFIYFFPADFAAESLLKFLFPQIALLTSAIFIGWLCGKFLEDLPFRALGAWFTKNWLKDFGLGLLIGTISIGLAALITLISGATSFQFNRTAGSGAIVFTLIASLIVFVFGAAAEEAFFRGYILQTFTRAHLILFGLLWTAIFFAFTHTNNPSANYLSFANTALAGLWFGVAYLKTRTLWFAIGLHLAWNWVQGAILGINVSGITEITAAPILQSQNVGSPVISGGDYGIEGGIACTVALVISTLLIWFLPILKPTEEMLKLTDSEKLNGENITA